MEKRNYIRSILKFSYHSMQDVFCWIIMTLFHLLYKTEDAVLFDNFTGNGYGDSPKYVYEEISKRNLKIKSYWTIKKTLSEDMLHEYPKGVQLVVYGSFKYLKVAAKSKIWLSNNRQRIPLKKRKNQFYINTFHSILPWKKVEFDVSRNFGSSRLLRNLKENKNTDLIVASCGFKEKIVRHGYRYGGNILRAIIPRDDVLIAPKIQNDELEKSIRGKLHLDANVKVCLYAPTFRDSKDISIYNIDYNKLLDTLAERFGGKWIALVRLHPTMLENSNLIQFNRNVIDASHFGDVQELLLITDTLITDYSSIMFDYMLVNKPVFLFAVDLEEYKKERDFYQDITELPFTLAVNDEELHKNILSFNQEEYERKLAAYERKIDLFKNSMSTSVILVNLIENKIKKK